MKLIKEFRDFAMKGNVVDLAIGVIIGAAFGAMVNSMVNDVLMPPIGKVVGGLDFSNLYISLSDKLDQANAEIATTQPTTNSVLGGAASMLGMKGRMPLDEAKSKGYPVIAYGRFVNSVINMLIVGFCMFIIVKLINAAHRHWEHEQAAAPPPPPPPQEVLLTEIRDILKSHS